MIPIGGLTGILLFYLMVFIGWVLTFLFIYLSIFNSKYSGLWLTIKSNPVIFIPVLIFMIMSNCLGVYVYYKNKQLDERLLHASKVRESRKVFILTEPRSYGEIIFPIGTKIFRNDPYDNGEENRAFSLTGLERAEFPNPVKIANLMVSAIDPMGKVWLAQKQQINGDWYETNQIIYFEIPKREHDITLESGEERLEAMQASFKPSQWIYKKQIESVEMEVPVKPFVDFKVK